MRPATRSRRLAGALIGASVMAVPLISPVSSWAADTPAPRTTSSDARHVRPSQSQWVQLDKVSKKHAALGVFGAEGEYAPVLTLPAGTTADQKAKAAADVPDGLKVSIRTSRFTKAQVDKVQKEVMAGKWHKDGSTYDLGSFYDGELDKIVVNTDAPRSVVSALKSAYGDKVEVVPSRFEQQADRFNDQEPFYGGASLLANNSLCTAGWKIHMVNPETNQQAYFLTTAGHCYHMHDLVKNRGNSAWMGWIKKVGPSDIEAMVGYQYDNQIWTGGYTTSQARLTYTGLGGMVMGSQVCVSGQTTFNHCGHPISSTSYSFSWKNGQQSGVTPAQYGFTYSRGGTNAARNNGTITQGGDSGAPVYILGGNAWAVGSHAGIVDWLDTAPNGCHCYQWRMYGVKMQAIYSQWHGVLSQE
ncbi:chymotrypsin family serine protease [Streptomyces sp. YKOK-I1]